MLISRETANLILDDAGILGRDREWILQNHDVVLVAPFFVKAMDPSQPL